MAHLLAIHTAPADRETCIGYRGTFSAVDVVKSEIPGKSFATKTEFSYRYRSATWPGSCPVEFETDSRKCTWLTLMTIEKDPTGLERRRRDIEMIRASLRGDASALDCLVARLKCVPRILMSINRRMGNCLSSHDLADLSQDTLLIVWGKLGQYEARAKLESWVYRFCFLEFMNRLRAKDRYAMIRGESLDTVADILPGPGSVTAGEYERLHLSLGDLGPPEAEIIRLKHFEELTFEDIGETLDISPNTAKTRYYRGLSWLRKRFDQGGGAGSSSTGAGEQPR